MSYSREQLMTALRNAHNAGDEEAARRIAQMIQARSVQAPEQNLDPAEGMNMGERALVGLGRSFDKTLGGIGSMLGLTDDEQRRENSAVYDRNATTAMRVGEFGGDIGQFAVPGGAVGKATAARGLMARMGAQAGTAAGVDATQQMGESGSVDTGRTALAAGAGAAGELLAPFFASGAKQVGRILGNRNRVEAGAQIVRQGGGNPAEYSRAQLSQLAEQAAEVARDVPEVAEEMAKFGTQVTRGRALGIGSKEGNELLRMEQMARNTRPELFKPIDDANERALRTSINRLAQSGGSQADDAFQAAQNVREGLLGARESAKAAAGEAYEQVGDAVFSADAAQPLVSNIAAALREANVRLSNPTRTAATREALEILDTATKQAQQASGFKLSAVNDVRQQLNDLFSRGMHESDKRALTIVKREFDRWRDSLPQSIIRGSDTAVDDLTRANALYADYMGKFKGREGGEKVVRDLLENPLLEAPEEVAKKVIGGSGKGVQASNAAIAAIKNAAPETVADLKAMVFYGMTNGLKDPAQRGTVLRGLRDAFSGRQSTLRQLYTPEELNEMSQFVQAFDRLAPKGEYAFKPGTAGELLRIAQQMGQSIPLLGGLLKHAEERAATMSIFGRPNPVLPGVTAGGFAASSGALVGSQ